MYVEVHDANGTYEKHLKVFVLGVRVRSRVMVRFRAIRVRLGSGLWLGLRLGSG